VVDVDQDKRQVVQVVEDMRQVDQDKHQVVQVEVIQGVQVVQGDQVVQDKRQVEVIQDMLQVVQGVQVGQGILQEEVIQGVLQVDQDKHQVVQVEELQGMLQVVQVLQDMLLVVQELQDMLQVVQGLQGKLQVLQDMRQVLQVVQGIQGELQVLQDVQFQASVQFLGFGNRPNNHRIHVHQVNHFYLYQFDQRVEPIVLVELFFVVFLVVSLILSVYLCRNLFLSCLYLSYLSFLMIQPFHGVVDRILALQDMLQVDQGVLHILVVELQVLA